MSEEIVIKIEGLSKKYQLGQNHSQGTLRHIIQDVATAPFKMFSRARKKAAEPAGEFWALKDVSFSVKKGEVVGVIGRNGAGKSTLLKVLSRITEPTEGRIGIKGRIASLLEVGTGFHPELTGRENIFLNGAILGMTRKEIRRKFDEIVTFSEVEKFLDTPVKRYSSGMYVRLAFAVAAHLEPEILVVDEVLAVGDLEFQKKCLAKMQNVANSGRTVLFVSHNLSTISTLCTSAIHMHQGRCKLSGSTEEVIHAYLTELTSQEIVGLPPERRPGTGEYRFRHIRPAKPIFYSQEPKVFEFEIDRLGGPVVSMYFMIEIRDLRGVIVTQCDSRLNGVWKQDFQHTRGEVVVDCLWFQPGTYTVDAFIFVNGIIEKYEQACTFEVSTVLPYPHSAPEESYRKGSALSRFEWNFSDADHGN
jgi:lipopolysaccharide transport system ATP-binding protein